MGYPKIFECVDHGKQWEILKEMEILDHLICPWENCMQINKQQLELDMEQHDIIPCLILFPEILFSRLLGCSLVSQCASKYDTKTKFSRYKLNKAD